MSVPQLLPTLLASLNLVTPFPQPSLPPFLYPSSSKRTFLTGFPSTTVLKCYDLESWHPSRT